jgi:hypothetical protein
MALGTEIITSRLIVIGVSSVGIVEELNGPPAISALDVRLLSRASYFGRPSKPLVSAAFAVVSTHSSYKEG